MKSVTITIDKCKDCPSMKEYYISDFCCAKMPSVNMNIPRRLISDIRTIPVWCPRPDMCLHRH